MCVSYVCVCLCYVCICVCVYVCAFVCLYVLAVCVFVCEYITLCVHVCKYLFTLPSSHINFLLDTQVAKMVKMPMPLFDTVLLCPLFLWASSYLPKMISDQDTVILLLMMVMFELQMCIHTNAPTHAHKCTHTNAQTP